MPVGSATGEAVPNEAVGAVDTAWVGAHAGSASVVSPAAEAAEALEAAESSTQICQPSGAGPQAGSGCQPAGGSKPSGGAGQFGGGLKRKAMRTSVRK